MSVSSACGRKARLNQNADNDSIKRMKFSGQDRDAIRSALLEWFRRNARPLPWRKSGDPYAVWVSEVMLQQT